MKYKIKPWNHQLKAIEQAVPLDEYALFFEMGAGKTSTIVNVLRHKYAAEGRVLRTLILCPPIVITNWKKEFTAHSAVGHQVACLTGSGKQRAADFHNRKFEQNIFVTNYEGLLMGPLYDQLMAWKPEVLVVDESHKCKDMTAKRTKLVTHLADVTRYRYILSGTPILNSPMDIFAQFRILDKGELFGKNFFAFRAKYFYDKNAAMQRSVYFPNWVIKPGAIEQINREIGAKSMHVAKADCMDLPPLVRTVVHVPLSPEQERMYKSMRDDFIAYINDKACVAQLAITKALRLQQIVSGFISVEGTDGGKRTNETFKENPRSKALKELLEQITSYSKCIVWAVFKENYGAIKRVCEELGLRYVEVHGEVSQKQKMAAVDEFNHDPGCKIFIGHPGSGGIGINLVAASYSIFYSRTFSLEYDLQAEARNYRGGSEIHEKVTRIDLVSPDTIDEIVMKRLAMKLEIGDKVLRDIASEL